MSVKFNSTTGFYSATTGLPSGAVFSATCFAVIDTDTNTYANVLGSANTGETVAFVIATLPDGVTIGVFDSATYAPGTGQVGGTAMTVGTWWQLGVSVNGASCTFYRAPLGTALTATTVANYTPPNPTASIIIGEYPPGGGATFWNGRVAAVKWWDAALNATEIAAEFTQFAPMRTANLLRYHPFHVAETTDYSGNGRTLTGGTGSTTGTDPSGIPDVALGPPIIDADGSHYLFFGSVFERTAVEDEHGATITARAWSVQSGPADVGALSATASVSWTPSALGAYVVRYSATNSEGTTTQDVTLTVIDQAGSNSSASSLMRP